MRSVSAIVVTYRTGPRLKECLYALAANQAITELIIVDNGNPEEVVAWLTAFAQQTEKATYVSTGDNLGFARANNIGAAEATADDLLMINPDCVIRHDAVVALQAAACERRVPCLVGGRIFGVDGMVQRGPMRRELTVRRVLSKLIGGAGINLPLSPQPDEPIAVDVTSGAFFLIDREQFEALGGFDGTFFLHVEDIDLCKQVQLAGGEVVYQPKAGALHYGATSHVSGIFVERHKAAGFARYFRKHTKGALRRFGVELVIPLIFAGLVGRALLAGRRAPH